MVCPTCGLDNDPSASACARCNTALARTPAPSAPQTPAFERPPRNGNHLPVIAGLAVVVLLALVAAAVVIYRSNPTDPIGAATAATAPATPLGSTTDTDLPPIGHPPLTADPQQQAQVIDELLDRSFDSRNKLNQAIDRVGRCTDLGAALDDMKDAGDERREQIGEVQTADLSAVPNGETIRSTLITALRYSLAADEAYVDWAEPAVSGGCTNTASRKDAYARGRAASDDAGAAKEAFLAEWNPVATRMGLESRSRQGI